MELTIVFIAILIATLIAVLWGQKKNGKYDERQEAIRNRGYKYGFYTMAIVTIAIICLKGFDIKISSYLTTILPLYCACLVISIYDIINQAYFRIKEKHMNGNGILLIIIGIFEAYFSITSFKHENLNTVVNFGMLAVLFVAIGVTILYVNYRNKRDEA